MMTKTTSRVAGTLKTGLLALSLVAAGAGAASAHGFGGGGGGHMGGGHMGGGFSEHMGGEEFQGGFHGGPAFHMGGYGGGFFFPRAFRAHYGDFRHRGFLPYGPDYAFAPYDVFRDDDSNCFGRVVKLGTHGHYRYVREGGCT